MNADASRVVVRSIAGGGDGVGTLPDGRTVFIPRAAPGDELQLRDIRIRSRFARAEIAAVLVPGPGRVDPPCPHYVVDRCGSCQLMHLDAERQRTAKASIAGDAMRRIAHLDVNNPEIVPSPEQFGYRSKVTFTIQGGRIGYHPVNEPTRVFDVRECLVAMPELRELHRALRSAREHLPRDHARVVLRIDAKQGRHVIVMTPPGDAWTGGIPLHRAMAGKGMEACIWWHPEGGAPRAVAGAADPWPVTVFEQVHPSMGRRVRADALAGLAPFSGRHFWDLYAGIGDTTAAIVAAGGTVDSIESDHRAVQLAEQRGPAGPRRIAALVEDGIGHLAKPDAIVTNPPRTGMDGRAIDGLLQSGAARIAYISCDPATLARDVARLNVRYRLAMVQAYDQFPQTSHLECLAVLERS